MSFLIDSIPGELEMPEILIWFSLKHVLVFTKAGKPVWARHGDEEVTSALMGILYTMFSIVEETGDELHEIELGGGRKMVYYHVEPLILGIIFNIQYL